MHEGQVRESVPQRTLANASRNSSARLDYGLGVIRIATGVTLTGTSCLAWIRSSTCHDSGKFFEPAAARSHREGGQRDRVHAHLRAAADGHVAPARGHQPGGVADAVGPGRARRGDGLRGAVPAEADSRRTRYACGFDDGGGRSRGA